jgi:protein MpaA
MADSQRSTANAQSGLNELRRLGRNVNGYLGETIDIASVLRDCVAAARAHGWLVEELPVSTEVKLLAFRRAEGLGRVDTSGSAPQDVQVSRKTDRALRVYISTGIHGDEPAGPLAVCQLLQENRWPERIDLWLCPCLNPTGFLANRRENAAGADLNREYLQPKAKETLAHIAWLERQPNFDLCLCLHEDWESHGFYVYELNPEARPSLAEAIVGRVAQVCPIDRSEVIEGRPARDGIIRPSIDPRSRPQWPESFFLLTHKTKLSYTLEAPSDFALPVRVAALVKGANAALRKVL